jgi:hypothetical protein
VGFDVTEVVGNRKLRVIVNNVTLTNTSGVIGVTVPASANLYVYGVNSAGTGYTATLTNVASNVLTATSGVLTVNWSNAITALKSQNGFANIDLATGAFNVTAIISGVGKVAKLTSIGGAVPVVAGTGAVSVPASASSPNGAQAASVTGYSESLVVTVQ